MKGKAKLNKHRSIINLIAKLEKMLNDHFEICDYWEADLCAIGIKTNNKLVYISTANYINQSNLLYDFDFEINSSENPAEIVKEGRNCSEEALIKAINSFWA
ncbi:hypothetical protein BKI52_42545 [marine bacterium AO1-C]|nr:hypothetical protein BKI52_42545 [marine bacterium AO1-C]